MAASYGQVNCSKPTVEKEKLILALYAVFSAISIVFYVTAIALIVKSRAYRRLLHRLTLYLAIGGILRSLAFVLQVLPVDVEQADNSTVTVRKGWEGVCVFAGFMIQYTGLIQAFTVLWICLYLFRMVLFQKQSEKIGHEVIGLVAAYLVPHLFTWEPFTTKSYGLLETRCWIVDNDCNSDFDLAFVYEMALNVVPNFTVTLIGLMLMAITIAALVRKFILKVLQLHQWAAIKEILPLAIYPTLYMLIFLARMIALVSGKSAALDVSITSPLNPLTLLEAGVLAKSAAQVTEARKHQANDPKCSELGWRPLAEPRQPLDLSLLSNSAPPVTPIRKRCTIEGCTALIAPSMWRIHMSLHASGALPGQVPAEWLLDQNLFVCPHCSQLVANTRQASHLQHCSQSLTNQIAHLQSSIAPEPQINQNLPTFEEVCQLHHPTLRFVPTKARPAFARALSTALKEVLRHNSEEAWLKLFMLPKCVLLSLKQRGVVNPHTSIESLCKMWLNNDLVTLWSMSLTRANLHSSSRTSTHSQEFSSAISLGHSGLMGKACRILLSSGIAPSNSTTLNLLQSKNPSCPHPTIPDIASNPITLGPSFDILHILRSFTKGTSAGPSGLSIQHLLDAASVPLQTPICDSLKGVVNILASGKAPKSVSAFLSGGRLIALNKGKFSEGRCTDIRPIVVGEVLRRLTGKCLCSILRDKFSTFFQPSQFGVACKAGVERVVHNMRKCIDDGWMSGDFVVCKVDMSNAFNRVSRQVVLDECSSFFPELLPWVSWCYGSHSLLWHSMGTISSQSGVQQGDPLGPMLFALVLHKLVSSIEADDDCINLSFNAWYLDDGILVGERSAAVRALHLIEELGPHLALVKSSILPNLEILGAPIGDIVHLASRLSFGIGHQKSKILVDIYGRLNVTLPSQFGVACKAGAEKIVHSLRRCIEENWLSGDFVVFKVDMSNAFNMVSRQAVMDQCATYFPELLPWVSWCYGSHTSLWHPMGQISSQSGVQQGAPIGYFVHCSRFIAEKCTMPKILLKALVDVSTVDLHVAFSLLRMYAVTRFNTQVPPDESIIAEEVLVNLPPQRALFKKLDMHAFQSLLSSSSPANKARILSVSAPHAGSWISVIPSAGLDLHLNSAECQIALRWWLGLDTSGGSLCPHCPDIALDPLGHHAASCRHGGDVVARHHNLRDIFANFCRRAHLSVRVEVGYGLARDQVNSRPADVLVQGWDTGKPAAFDITVASPLTPVTLNNASTSVGAAAYAAELRKHVANDTRCQELGWTCIPLAVETYGNWGMEAQSVFSRLASLLAIGQAIPKPKMLGDI
eukprot:Em0013g1068a